AAGVALSLTHGLSNGRQETEPRSAFIVTSPRISARDNYWERLVEGTKSADPMPNRVLPDASLVFARDRASRQSARAHRRPGSTLRKGEAYCFIFSWRLIAAAASWAFFTESACLPASWSDLASLAKATAFLEASSVLPAVASITC